ncbi:enoyl-CoA hydratase/isomerase family protein [Dehalococcoidia bacterium]|nr:enoyl-CoA hydratase/isomerase family protein [Dehalococcoidia bacterium]
MNYEKYEHILVDVRDGIAFLTINRPDKLNATNARLHWELSKIWLDIGEDDEVRVAMITGAGRAFSVGGDFEVLEEAAGNGEVVAQLFKEARDIVHNMINLDKPVISAINGHAVGAGLAVALMSDISVAAENARLMDGHVILGVAAGDHGAAIWPLLVGMAKAKYYLMTGDSVDGKEAERIGLVSMVVPDEEVVEKATQIARRLADGPTQAINWTKQSLNQWLRMSAATSFDYSAALEMLGFLGPDIKKGLAGLKEKKAPKFH